MTFDAWLTFSGLWFLLGLPVGPNAIATLSTAARDGVGAGLAVAAGITLAGLLHATLATFGFGAVLTAWPAAFDALQLAGAGYLAWLGTRLILRAGLVVPAVAAGRPAWRAVRHGALVSLSNPKAILTYMAAFPAALDPAAPIMGQFAILLPTALGIVFVIYAGHAMVGVGIGRALLSASRRRWFDRAAGGMFVGCAALLAASALRR
ncbi:MAG: LysE family translocator [Thalassobaculum sp.]|uniref:LysE family translocator n=1 Tax=Thalassobaculum sp. TaxID=2022740 RepID=UPI0032EBB095